jgi:hypothetical protein
MAKLIDRLWEGDLFHQKRSLPDLVVSGFQRLIMPRVEAKHVTAFDHHELSHAAAPLGQVSFVRLRLLRQRKASASCFCLGRLLVAIGCISAATLFRSPRADASAHRAHKSSMNRFYDVGAYSPRWMHRLPVRQPGIIYRNQGQVR